MTKTQKKGFKPVARVKKLVKDHPAISSALATAAVAAAASYGVPPGTTKAVLGFIFGS